ncbi:uncharacterized protein LOC143276883 [Babylonia areolata]|uniref:uncharacterized protein LOC143276883 n=1 Tax=Babylonia areolata TaxID=304850 RepID=UPI003FD611DA
MASNNNSRNDNTRHRHLPTSAQVQKMKRAGTSESSTGEPQTGSDVTAGVTTKKTSLPLKSPVSSSSSSSSVSSASGGTVPNGRSSSRSLLVPELMAKLAVPVYFFTISATWWIGMVEVMPSLYRHHPSSVLLAQRVLMVVLYVQTMGNWLCIRYVDSSYSAFLRHRWRGRRMGRERERQRGEWETARVGGEEVEEGEEEGEGGGGCGQHHRLSSPPPQQQQKQQQQQKEQQQQQQEEEEQQQTERSNPRKDPPWKPPFNPPKDKTSFSYWSWIPCYTCQVMRPPRCHHCAVCDTCVLKRDHHCYFAGSCVGWKNQRHFLVFAVWACFSCCYATAHALPYLYENMWPVMRWFDLLAPVVVIRWVLGFVPGWVCVNMCVQTLLFYFILLSFNFVMEHLTLIVKGVTSFEATSLKKGVEVRDGRGLGGRFRSVLGRNWGLSFLCPFLHWWLEVEEDPENWPSIQLYRHSK